MRPVRAVCVPLEMGDAAHSTGVDTRVKSDPWAHVLACAVLVLSGGPNGSDARLAPVGMVQRVVYDA